MGYVSRTTTTDADGKVWDSFNWHYGSPLDKVIRERRHTGVPPQHELDAITAEFTRKLEMQRRPVNWKREGF